MDIRSQYACGNTGRISSTAIANAATVRSLCGERQKYMRPTALTDSRPPRE